MRSLLSHTRSLYGKLVGKQCKQWETLFLGGLQNQGTQPRDQIHFSCLLNWQTGSLPTAPPGSVQFSSVTQSCPTLCDPMDCSMPGLPVHHQLLEITQTHVHWLADDIQESHPLSSPSPHTFNLSQQHSLFKWVSPLHQVAKVLEFQLQHESFQWTPKTDSL